MLRKFKRAVAPVSLVAILASFLVACGSAANDPAVTQDPGATTPPSVVDNNNNNNGADEIATDLAHPLAAMHETLANFPTSTADTAPAIQGGTLRIAEVASSPFAGLLGGAVFSSNQTDSNIAQFAGLSSSIFSANSNLAFGNTGIATATPDTQNRRLIIDLNYDVYWHDGVPLTLDDLVFAYEIIAHPDYTGIRWTAAVQDVVGIQEFRNGEADTIEGLVLSEDGRQLIIYFNDFPPSHMNFGIWSAPTPRHIFEGIPVAQMPYSDPVRVNPIGWGPFIVENIVPGESVHFVRNDNFVFGAPVLDAVTVEIVHPDLVIEAMHQGLFDIASMDLSQFPYHQNPTEFSYIASLSGIYNYTLFRMGYWDAEEGRNVFDPNRPTSNIYLRRAMAHAIDQQLVTDNLWHGLRFPATSIVTPIHAGFLDETLQGRPFNVELANSILDEAGFIDIDGDGFREDPNGEQLTLIFGIHEAPNNELTAQIYIQMWGDVGLRVELFEGRMQEFVSFMDQMSNDDDNGVVDLMFGNWIPGFNPNPSGRWGATSISNRSRFTSPAMDEALERAGSIEAWDEAFMRQALLDYQHAFNYYMPAILNNWRINLNMVNNRVVNYTTDVDDNSNRLGSDRQWHLVGVSR